MGVVNVRFVQGKLVLVKGFGSECMGPGFIHHVSICT